tara:strand:+ start:795 stop:2432 length:1638 start_codon:yes stop_codon:yes gene_type:complete
MAKEVIEMEVKSNVGAVAKDVEKLDKATDKASGGFKGMGTAIKGMGTALKAAGIGLVVALMAKLMEVFSKNQKVVDTFDTAMTSLSIAFNDLFGFLSDNVGKVTGFFKDLFENPKENIIEFGNAIKDNLIERFMSLLDVFGHLGTALKKLFERDFKGAIDSVKDAGKESIDVWTGVDNSVDKLTEVVTKGAAAIKEYTKSTINQAKAITETNKAAQLAAVEFARLNAQYLKDAEVQRQIRDDETKTFAERIKANEDLGKVLEKQQNLQRQQVQTQIDAAQAQFDINGSIENRIALGEAQNAMLELEETITGQMSEQKTNQVALEKELLETQRELRAESLEGTERELQELKTAYEQKLEMARKSGADITAITKIYEKQQTAIKEREAQKQKDLDKAKLDFEIGMANQGLQAISDAAGEGTALAKAAAIAQATISGVQGVQNAFTAANANIGATAGSFGAYPVTMAALAGTFAAMNIAKIAAGTPPSGGGGGGGGQVVPQTPAPQMMSGAFELGGGLAPEAMKAFVVTDEMTNSQNQLANIRRQATI